LVRSRETLSVGCRPAHRRKSNDFIAEHAPAAV
jgi:hypothetical protein